MQSRNAVGAALWSGADALVRHGLQLLTTVILARLLSPADFGTIALLYVFIGIASALADSGFSSALIQARQLSELDTSTVFWLSMATSFIAAGCLLLAAPWIATVFSVPVLAPLTRLMAANVVIATLGSIPSALLSRNLDFRTPMRIGAFASVLSTVVAIGMAAYGFGVWALAAQAILSTGTSTALLWRHSSWRPAVAFSFPSVTRLFRFGGFLLVSSLLDLAYSRVYAVLIGKHFGVAELGLYNRADSTKQLPVGVLSGILTRVSYPLFSMASADLERLRRGVRIAVRSLMLINVPMMLGMVAVSRPLVVTLFGPQWLPAVPLLRILCLAGVLWPLHVINLNVLIAQGHSSRFFRLEVVKKLLGLLLLALGARFGLSGIAWSQVALGFLGLPVNAYYTGSHIGYGALSQLRDAAPVFLLSGVMALTVMGVDQVLAIGPALRLAILVLTGLAVFLGGCIAFRLSSFREAMCLLRSYLANRRGSKASP